MAMLVWFDHALPGLQKPPWLLPMKYHPVAKEYEVVMGHSMTTG